MGIVEDDHKDKNSESFSNVNRPEFLLFSQKRRFRLLVKDGWQIMSEYKCCCEKEWTMLIFLYILANNFHHFIVKLMKSIPI